LEKPADRTILDEKEFIRHRLFASGSSRIKRYGALVLANPTPWALFKYEFLTTLLGSIPGMLGIGLRSILWRMLFAKIGRGVVFGCRVSIRHPERIVLGDGVVIDDDALIDGRGAGDEGLVLGDRVIVNRGASIQAKVGSISIGADSNVGAQCRIISQGPIHIAENVSLAGGSVIAGGRYTVNLTGESEGEKQRFTGGEIRIDRNVRIGMNAMVQDGVSIGEGAIVAPGSVVLSNVAEHTVVSGSPARVWRNRQAVEPRPVAPSRLAATTDTTRPASELNLVRQQVRTYLEQIRFANFADGSLTETSSLFDNDVLDSLTFVDLLGWLEQTHNISASPDELLPENFDSVDRIAQFVVNKRSGEPATT
jgi:acetyltransferase-like isoleucine patch superfamily enzyme/acyl carrier protein